MTVEWDYEEKCWIIDGEKYWTWNAIHNLLKLKIKLVELEKLASNGIVTTTFFNNPRSPDGRKRTEGYLKKDVIAAEKKREKTDEELFEELSDYMETQDRSDYW